MWLHERSKPTGAAKLSRQSLRSVESRSYLLSVLTVVGRSSVSLSVCKQSIWSPTRTRSAPKRISSKEACWLSESEKYLSRSPAFSFVPMSSSSVILVKRRWSLSLIIRSNWSTASKNFATASLSSMSLGMRCPRHKAEKLLCCAMRFLVVLVRKR